MRATGRLVVAFAAFLARVLEPHGDDALLQVKLLGETRHLLVFGIALLLEHLVERAYLHVGEFGAVGSRVARTADAARQKSGRRR